MGFFLRVDVGGGYLNSSASDVNMSMGGFAIPLGLAIGGAIAENFILAGDVWVSLGLSPTVKMGSLSATPSNTTFSILGIGLNLTYYFMPANVYVSVSPSMTFVELTISNVSGSTEVGFGGKVAVGKEWWVADRLALGVAGQFVFGINVDKGPSPPTWTTLGGGLAFTMTVN